MVHEKLEKIFSHKALDLPSLALNENIELFAMSARLDSKYKKVT